VYYLARRYTEGLELISNKAHVDLDLAKRRAESIQKTTAPIVVLKEVAVADIGAVSWRSRRADAKPHEPEGTLEDMDLV